jgi:hypothetical protein
VKLEEIFGAAVDPYLPMAYEMAIINHTHLQKHDTKSLYVVVNVLCADIAEFFYR